MSAIRQIEDLTVNERAQFEKAVDEGGSGTVEWEHLMLMITVGSSGNGEAFERRQAVRTLYSERRAA